MPGLPANHNPVIYRIGMASRWRQHPDRKHENTGQKSKRERNLGGTPWPVFAARLLGALADE
jgi:hypothetical protein